jgi:hypothetical protein
VVRGARFDGHIAGVGTTSGVRLVVGHWHSTPLGAFSDVMVETAAGHRLLLAPDDEVAAFVEGTYTFDEVRVEDVRVRAVGDRWEVATPSLTLELEVGGRTPLGWLLRAVPRALATAPRWAAVTDPVARLVLRGVRTRGTARAGRREYYGATDAWAVRSAVGALEGRDLGALADVDPPCRFGFSSTPRRPSLTRVVTTVAES